MRLEHILAGVLAFGLAGCPNSKGTPPPTSKSASSPPAKSDNPEYVDAAQKELDGMGVPMKFGKGGGEASPGNMNLPKPVLFDSEKDRNSEIYIWKPDGSITNLTNSPAWDCAPSWSPDGTQIAFISNRHDILNLYVMNGDGSGIKRITNDTLFDDPPAWSPDGEYITYSSLQKGERRLWAVRSEGGRPIRLQTGGNAEKYPAWSPDGTQIAFASQRKPNDGIYILNSDGTERILTRNGTYPTWSPDGKRIAFVADFSGPNLFTMNTDGSDRKRLSGQEKVLANANAWLDNNTLLFFSPTKGPLVATLNDALHQVIPPLEQARCPTLSVQPDPANKLRAGTIKREWFTEQKKPVDKKLEAILREAALEFPDLRNSLTAMESSGKALHYDNGTYFWGKTQRIVLWKGHDLPLGILDEKYEDYHTSRDGRVIFFQTRLVPVTPSDRGNKGLLVDGQFFRFEESFGVFDTTTKHATYVPSDRQFKDFMVYKPQISPNGSYVLFHRFVVGKEGQKLGAVSILDVKGKTLIHHDMDVPCTWYSDDELALVRDGRLTITGINGSVHKDITKLENVYDLLVRRGDKLFFLEGARREGYVTENFCYVDLSRSEKHTVAEGYKKIPLSSVRMQKAKATAAEEPVFIDQRKLNEKLHDIFREKRPTYFREHFAAFSDYPILVQFFTSDSYERAIVNLRESLNLSHAVSYATESDKGHPLTPLLNKEGLSASRITFYGTVLYVAGKDDGFKLIPDPLAK